MCSVQAASFFTGRRVMSSDSSVSDYCRLCKISFKVKFGSSVGKQGYSSSENLFRPSKRKECFGVVLAEICKEVGLPLVQDSRQYSDRVCNPCGRKIRNLGQLYQLIRPAVTSTESTPVKSSKRTLDTPDKASPAWRKSKTVRVNSPAAKSPSIESSTSAKGKSRKSLSFTENHMPSTVSKREDEMLHRLNIDDLPNDGMKIVYMNPSGNVVVRIPRNEQTKAVVKNIAMEKWREASNFILKHEDIAPEINKGISKTVSTEFNMYLKSGSMLEARNPDELAGFSNKLFLEEIRIYCPVWFQTLLGASGLAEDDVKEFGRDVNSLAFATATIARVRNFKASAIHHRISSIMFHSGVKHDDLIRLNRLGICMSPDTIVMQQKKMNEQLEGKIRIWKATIEENRGALMLAQEVLQKQESIAPRVNVSAAVLEPYNSYSAPGFKALTAMLNKELENGGLAFYNVNCLQTVIENLQTATLPLYKYVKN